MKLGKWAGLFLVALPLVAGCGDFWEAPGGSSSGGSSNPGGGTTTGSGTPSGVFYVLNQTAKQIAAYSILAGTNSNTLTTVAGSPYTVPGTPYSIAISPSGTFLYIGTSSGIYLYDIADSNSASGA